MPQANRLFNRGRLCLGEEEGVRQAREGETTQRQDRAPCLASPPPGTAAGPSASTCPCPVAEACGGAARRRVQHVPRGPGAEHRQHDRHLQGQDGAAERRS